jgi:hypothetical protein
MVEVPLIPSDSGNELALFRNIAIIAQSFWAGLLCARHAGARLLDIVTANFLIDDHWRE